MVYDAGIDPGSWRRHFEVITAEREVAEDLEIENEPRAFARIFRKYKAA